MYSGIYNIDKDWEVEYTNKIIFNFSSPFYNDNIIPTHRNLTIQVKLKTCTSGNIFKLMILIKFHNP